MAAFREVLDHCYLKRIPYKGCMFTWDNGRQERENTKQVLDRGFLNPSGWALCPNALISHIPTSVSDHLCLLLELDGPSNFSVQRKNRFLFELAWLKEENCEEIIKNSWDLTVGEGLTGIQSLLDKCAMNLKSWNKNSLKQIQKQLNLKQQVLLKLQDSTPTSINRSMRIQTEREINHLLEVEETMWL